MGHSEQDPGVNDRRPWKAGRKIGAKRALKPQRYTASFNLAGDPTVTMPGGSAHATCRSACSLPGTMKPRSSAWPRRASLKRPGTGAIRPNLLPCRIRANKLSVRSRAAVSIPRRIARWDREVPFARSCRRSADQRSCSTADLAQGRCIGWSSRIADVGCGCVACPPEIGSTPWSIFLRVNAGSR